MFQIKERAIPFYKIWTERIKIVSLVIDTCLQLWELQEVWQG